MPAIEDTRERGATVHIVGKAKTPDSLRNTSDPFFEWQPGALGQYLKRTDPASSTKAFGHSGQLSAKPRG